MIYGLIGVPLALLTIAGKFKMIVNLIQSILDIGLFLNKLVHKLSDVVIANYGKFKKWQKVVRKKFGAFQT